MLITFCAKPPIKQIEFNQFSNTIGYPKFTVSNQKNTKALLVMPNGDPRDGFFDPTLTHRIDSYSIFNKA